MWVFEWTGEQFLPAVKNAAQVYQYVHRYIYISELLKGKRVLDIAAGDGSGSNILAGTAASVVGIVADTRIADRASERYKKPNLEFISGLVDNIPVDYPFDAVVFFDVDDYEAVLFGVKRFLKRDGLFIISVACRDENGSEDLRQLLMRDFTTAQIFAQGVFGVSMIEPMVSKVDSIFKHIVMTREDANEFRPVPAGSRVPSQLIAIAANSTLTMPELGSTLCPVCKRRVTVFVTKTKRPFINCGFCSARIFYNGSGAIRRLQRQLKKPKGSSCDQSQDRAMTGGLQ